jgi:coenzyme F420-reducing hydrogenase gamma subunit
MLAIKGCPPKPEQVVEALQAAGIAVDRRLFENIDAFPGALMKRYQGKPEFDESLFRVD